MINQQTNLSEVVTWPCRRNSKPSFYVVMWKSQHGFELFKDWILRPQVSKRITPSFAIGSGHLKIPKLSKQYDIIRSVQFQKMLAYIYISHLSTLYSPDIFFSNPPLCPLIGQSPGQYVKVGQICRWLLAPPYEVYPIMRRKSYLKILESGFRNLFSIRGHTLALGTTYL